MAPGPGYGPLGWNPSVSALVNGNGENVKSWILKVDNTVRAIYLESGSYRMYGDPGSAIYWATRPADPQTQAIKAGKTAPTLLELGPANGGVLVAPGPGLLWDKVDTNGAAFIGNDATKFEPLLVLPEQPVMLYMAIPVAGPLYPLLLGPYTIC